MWNQIVKRLNVYVLVGAGLVSVALMMVWAVFSWLSGVKENNTVSPTAVLLIIQAPTITPTQLPSPTPDVNATQQALEEAGKIHVGGYVQITGTGRDGLRLRAGPGLRQPLLSLGYDSEVFEVRDGPEDVDGLVWWYLVAPYDDSRSGWAAADYLSAVALDE
ncbi:MAG: SH3 domain-containing protein [Anaerolineae bacterium]|nr:SH3 domain-containing protein [Anaerolineae bacterium]